MYVRERLRRRNRPGRFVEIGVGRGLLSRLLLELGWRGTGFDLSDKAVAAALAANAAAVADGRFTVECDEWLDREPSVPVDLVISSMVIEHLPLAAEARYFERAKEELAMDGFAILLVPSSPKHWGVEDDIAGHLRRYSAAGIRKRLSELGWRATHTTGLTWPLSNLLLPISNRLVERTEGRKRDLELQRRTEQSGIRSVPFKTVFPAPFGLVLNEVALYPFHLLQKAGGENANSLVLYAECVPERT
jgi:SAM-dependent methyltransferase